MKKILFSLVSGLAVSGVVHASEVIDCVRATHVEHKLTITLHHTKGGGEKASLEYNSGETSTTALRNTKEANPYFQRYDLAGNRESMYVSTAVFQVGKGEVILGAESYACTLRVHAD